MIKRQMQARRDSLAAKLEALEQQVTSGVNEVTSTVSDVRDTVEGTVGTVKDSVEQTLETFRDTLNLPLQIERHPWAMLGGAVALGFVGGRMLPAEPAPALASRGDPRRTGFIGRSHEGFVPEETAAGHQASPPRQQQESPSFFARFLAPEVQKLKALALGTALGLVRDYVARSTPPEIGGQLREMFDSVATKIGAEPVPNLWHEQKSAAASTKM